MGATQSTLNSHDRAGAQPVTLQIFLGAQPRLLRDMLHLAFSQLLGNAEVITLGSQENPASQKSAVHAAGICKWWIMTTENGGSADKQIQSALSQMPELCVAALEHDARSLHVYTLDDDGQIDETTHTDFSLAQLLDILQSGQSQHAR